VRQDADFVETYVGRGLLGVKTGHGSSTYPDSAYQRPGFVEGDR
jgi:hypothetical protein